MNQQDAGRTYCTQIGDVIQLPVWDLIGVLYRFIRVPELWPWLPVITGYKWDYTFYKWGYKYL